MDLVEDMIIKIFYAAYTEFKTEEEKLDVRKKLVDEILP